MSKGAQGPTVERLQLAERVRLLREEGLTQAAIANQLGISRSYAAALDTDPYGSKDRARKDSYAQPCPKCGTPMCGSYGRAKSSMLCATCTPHPPKTWTREHIIEVFQAFYVEFGRSPTTSDVLGRFPSQLPRASELRRRELDDTKDFALPHIAHVKREFGSWPAAVEAAGLSLPRMGSPAHRSRKFGRRQEQILALLDDGPKRFGELRVACDCASSIVTYAVRTLIKAGRIERVSRGIYRLTDAPRTKGRTMAREFVVLSRNGTGWIPMQTVEAPTASLAVEKVADGEGAYVAVPSSYWNELQVGTVTKLAVIQEPVAA